MLWITGAWPEHDVDHINGVRNDNRWSNLREVTRTVNIQNQRIAQTRNVAGLLGVSFEKARNKYKAGIVAGGKYHNLGRFNTAEEAHAAYLKAKRELHEGCTI